MLEVTVSSVSVMLLVDDEMMLPDVINKLFEIFNGTFNVIEPLDVVFITKLRIVGINEFEPKNNCVPL